MTRLTDIITSNGECRYHRSRIIVGTNPYINITTIIEQDTIDPQDKEIEDANRENDQASSVITQAYDVDQRNDTDDPHPSHNDRLEIKVALFFNVSGYHQSTSFLC